MASPRAILSLLDAPDGCDPAFYAISRRFRQMRRYQGNRPEDVHKVYRLLGLAAAGRPGHGPVHLLLESVVELGFAQGGSGPAYLHSERLLALTSTLKLPSWMLGGLGLLLFSLRVRVFGRGPLGTRQLLFSSYP